MLLRDTKQCCGCLELFFVGEMEKKQAIWCLKCKSINLLMHFNRQNHAVKKHSKSAHALFITRLHHVMYACTVHTVGVFFCKILHTVKLHIVKTTLQYYRSPLVRPTIFFLKA